MHKGKILVIADSATGTSGYSNQMDVILPVLVNRGWDVYQIGCNCWNVKERSELKDDGYYHYKGIKIIENPDLGKAEWGIYPSKETIIKIYNDIKPDIIFSLNDFYRVGGLVEISQEFTDKWVHWLPIDNPYDDPLWSSIENKMTHLMLLTEFGYKKELPKIRNVKNLYMVYHAVDSDIYRPINKEQIKKEHGLTGHFVITTVGRNQPRKMIYYTADVVCRFLADHPDSLWICKTNPVDHAMDNPPPNMDLISIVKKYGVENRVLFEANELDFEEMNNFYNSGDVFISLTGGEGFNIPIVESMLAGVPCILNNNTSAPELTGGWRFGLPVSIIGMKYVKSFGSFFDLGDKTEAYDQLLFAYNDWKNGSRWLKRAGGMARDYHKHMCGKDNIVDQIEDIFLRVLRYNNKLIWYTSFGKGVGFSNLSENIIPELEKLGYDVYCADWMNGSSPTIDGHFKELWEKYKNNISNLNVEKNPQIVCWNMEAFDTIKGDYKIGWAFVESTRLRDFYQDRCNKMDYILTTSDKNKKVHENSGITTPVRVVPPCIDSNVFPELNRNRKGDEPFTFLHIGVLQDRKNPSQLVEGYIKAFPDNGKTKLIFKSNHFGKLDEFKGMYKDRSDIEWIYTDETPLSKSELLDLYGRADCYINISHGEGIGMPDMEALSTGIPVIGANWDARSDFLDNEVGWVLNVSSMGPAYQGVAPEDCGEWAHYDGTEYIETLKYVASHPEECREKGRKGAERIREKFQPSQTAKVLDDILMEIYYKKNNFNSIDFDEYYYTNVHKYAPEWHDMVADNIISKCDGLNGKVIDMGCGRGYMMKHLLSKGKDVVGIEISDYAVNNPLPECTGKIKKGNILYTDYNNKEFDWGVSFSVFEHIPENQVDIAIREMGRICKKCYISAAMIMYPGHEKQLAEEDPTHITLHTKEWWIDRFENNNMKVLWSDGCTLIAEEKVIETKPVNKGDRILVGIPTKDRPQSLTRLLKSLKDQTFNDFDVIVVDDSVADIRQNAELREAVIDISKNGHIINVVKGVNLNQAVAHNHILNHAILNDYKLVFRVDDDITLDKHHLSRIFSHFVKDRKCEYAAMGGIFLNPYIDDKVQVAPEDWNTKEEFSGNIDVCTNTAQIVSYPENIKYRDDIQHLYSSYVYRPELMKSVGGFPTNLSMVGFREETLGLYELYLSGYKMKIVTNAKGYHWNEQTGGCRSVNESVAMDMYLSDNKIFRDNIRKLKDKYGVL